VFGGCHRRRRSVPWVRVGVPPGSRVDTHRYFNAAPECWSVRCSRPSTATPCSSRHRTSCRWTPTPCSMPAGPIRTSRWPSTRSGSTWSSKPGCVRPTCLAGCNPWPRGHPEMAQARRPVPAVDADRARCGLGRRAGDDRPSLGGGGLACEELRPHDDQAARLGSGRCTAAVMGAGFLTGAAHDGRGGFPRAGRLDVPCEGLRDRGSMCSRLDVSEGRQGPRSGAIWPYCVALAQRILGPDSSMPCGSASICGCRREERPP
jgi:hypothetical protein